MNREEIGFQLVTESSVHIASVNDSPSIISRSTESELVLWGGTKVYEIEEAMLQLTNQKSGQSSIINFLAVDQSYSIIRGCESMENLNLTSPMINLFIIFLTMLNTTWKIIPPFTMRN